MASYRVGDWVLIQFSPGDEEWARINELDETDSTQSIRCGESGDWREHWPFSDDIVEHCEFHSRSET